MSSFIATIRSCFVEMRGSVLIIINNVSRVIARTGCSNGDQARFLLYQDLYKP